MERVQFNVGGTIFKCFSKTLLTFPDSKLAQLNEDSEHFDKENNEYYFDRNPQIFGFIIDAYRTGEIHMPNDVCGSNFKTEIEYWELDISDVAPCCWKTLYRAENDVTTMKAITENVHINSVSNHTNIAQSLRHKMWLFLDDPKSSKYAMIWGIFISIAIILSTIETILESLDIFYVDDYTDHEKNYIIQFMQRTGLPYNGNETTSDTQKKLHLLWRQSPCLIYMDACCFAILTIELTLVFTFCPRKKNLYKCWMRISELICNISFWISFGLQINIFPDQSEFVMRAYIILRFLTILKLVRLFRLTRHIRIFNIMCITFRNSTKEINVLCIMLIILCTFFGTLVYIAELFHTTVFENIFKAMYWSLITLTTVGYGDYVPSTDFGHVVASACAVMGILVLALPVGVIATKFNALYAQYRCVSQHLHKHPSSIKALATPICDIK